METTEHTDSQVAACGSTRCKYNDNMKCTAETIRIGQGGDCKSEVREVRHG